MCFLRSLARPWEESHMLHLNFPFQSSPFCSWAFMCLFKSFSRLCADSHMVQCHFPSQSTPCLPWSDMCFVWSLSLAKDFSHLSQVNLIPSCLRLMWSSNASFLLVWNSHFWHCNICLKWSLAVWAFRFRSDVYEDLQYLQNNRIPECLDVMCSFKNPAPSVE